MKFEPNEKYTTIAAYVILVNLINALCVVFCLYFTHIVGFLLSLLNIMKPLIYGFIIAFMCDPAVRFFENRLFRFLDKKKPHPKLRMALSLIVTYVALLTFLTLFIAFIIPQAAGSYQDLQSKILDYIDAVNGWIETTLDKIPAIDIIVKQPGGSAALPPESVRSLNGSVPNILANRFSQVEDNVMFFEIQKMKASATHFDIIEILQKLVLESYSFFTDLTPYLYTFIKNLLTETKNLLLGLIISVYYLSAKKRLLSGIKVCFEAILPARAAKPLTKAVGYANVIFAQYLNGKIADAILLGVLCFGGMTLLQMPYAPLISLLVGVTNIIPYVGPFLGAVPGAFIIFVTSPVKALWFVLLIIALQQFDCHFIEPHILKTRISMDSVWIIVSVIVMGGLFGVAGMLIGAPIFAVLYMLFKQWVEQRLIRKNMPPDTIAYQ